MAKKLCKGAEKQIEKDFEGYVERVRGGQYVCRKCGRVSVEKKDVCKPAKMKG